MGRILVGTASWTDKTLLASGWYPDDAADATRRLLRTDPDGRDQVVSCGAALHHLLVALADAGQGARVRRLPDPTRPHHLATVEPAMHVDVDVDAGLASAIDLRRTDRRPFRAWPVPPELTGELAEIASSIGRTGRRRSHTFTARSPPWTPTWTCSANVLLRQATYLSPSSTRW